ncbi:MAG TPA: hypothetical protein VGK67_40555 [Myxococcales bacterium]|jgi:hypothetical protein
MPTGKTSRPRVLAFAALAAGVVACASSLDGLAPFPCGLDYTCPENFTCVAGSCVTVGGDSPDAGPPARACEYHDDCADGAKEGACLAIWGGGSACAAKCSGITNGCPGEDCKLVLSGVSGSQDLVPACTAAGAAKENAPCTSVNSCSYGLTCAAMKYDSSSYVCTEICSPMKTSCTNDNKRCTYGMAGYPADWGLCYLP